VRVYARALAAARVVQRCVACRQQQAARRRQVVRGGTMRHDVASGKEPTGAAGVNGSAARGGKPIAALTKGSESGSGRGSRFRCGGAIMSPRHAELKTRAKRRRQQREPYTAMRARAHMCRRAVEKKKKIRCAGSSDSAQRARQLHAAAQMIARRGSAQTRDLKRGALFCPSICYPSGGRDVRGVMLCAIPICSAYATSHAAQESGVVRWQCRQIRVVFISAAQVHAGVCGSGIQCGGVNA